MLFNKLAHLDELRIQAVLDEYFLVCKMIYRIKSTINYTWHKHYDLDELIGMYQNDHTFQKMQSIVHRGLINVFQGTDPDEPVLGTIMTQQEQAVAKMSRRKTIKLATPPPEIFNDRNMYDAVAYLIPEATSVIDDFLGIITRYQIIGSHDFHHTLDRVKERDPTIMSKLHTPKELTATQSSFGGDSRYNSRVPNSDAVSVKNKDSEGEKAARKTKASGFAENSKSPARQSKAVSFIMKDAKDMNKNLQVSKSKTRNNDVNYNSTGSRSPGGSPLPKK